jgi:acetylornithine deacetylase/succinyl-diaminopimelate desuccinylase-like protein
MNVFELTKALMSVPSTSGEEGAVGFRLRDHLESLGWNVEMQRVSENQNNVIATFNDEAAGLVFDAFGHGAAVHSAERG